jgi:AraC family transcriptional regulator
MVVRTSYQDFATYISHYVQDNLHHELVIDELAIRVGISRFHLNRLFQAITGFQIGEFIQRRRLQQAHALLAAGEKVIDVCLAVGYESHSSFARAFHKAFGCTPSSIKDGDGSWQTPNTLKNLCRRDMALQPEWFVLPEQTFYGHYGAGFEDHSFVRLAGELVARLPRSMEQPTLAASLIGVALESPWEGAPEQSRFFMGLAEQDVPDNRKMEAYLRAGGRWARFYHRGNYELMWQTISRIYAGWVIPEGVALRDHHIVQHYLNDPRATPEQDLLTELYFPVVN